MGLWTQNRGGMGIEGQGNNHPIGTDSVTGPPNEFHMASMDPIKVAD